MPGWQDNHALNRYTRSHDRISMCIRGISKKITSVSQDRKEIIDDICIMQESCPKLGSVSRTTGLVWVELWLFM